ncbi:MAG: peptide ABC transporter substrate-binding protein [Gemmatimonadaceae bacterium]
MDLAPLTAAPVLTPASSNATDEPPMTGHTDLPPRPTAARARRAAGLLASSALALLAAGCGGGRPDAAAGGAAEHGGTVVIATAADPDILLPPLVTSLQGKQVTDFLFDHLAEMGPALNTVGDAGFAPRLADRWEWAPDSLSIAFHIDPRARWHDGVPVRASDVRFTHRVYTDPAVGSPFTPVLANIDSVSVRDSLTAVVWYRRRSPEQFFDAAYQMQIVPEHLLKDVKPAELKTSELARHPVGTGPFRFVRWTPGASLEVVADTTYYRGRPKLDRVIWSVSPDFSAATTKLFAGEADLFEPLRPENLAEVAKHPELKVVTFPSLDYGFMQFNLREPKTRRPHPLFGDRALRRALTMALDRRSMVRNVFDSLGAVGIGPVVRAQATADTTIAQIPYDLAAAKRTLDSLGWRDADGDGYRERDGRPLAFTLLTPVSSKNRVRLAVLVQEQLKQAGVRVRVDQMDFSAFLAREIARDFDAVMGGWHIDPSPSGVRQMWGTAGSRGKDGSNYGSYESPVFDAYVDSALASLDPAKSKAYFRRAYETIVADAPAVWLYEPKPAAAVHKRLELPGRRADAWWAGLAEWSVPAAARIPRDRLGLAARAP